MHGISPFLLQSFRLHAWLCVKESRSRVFLFRYFGFSHFYFLSRKGRGKYFLRRRDLQRILWLPKRLMPWTRVFHSWVPFFESSSSRVFFESLMTRDLLWLTLFFFLWFLWLQNSILDSKVWWDVCVMFEVHIREMCSHFASSYILIACIGNVRKSR